MTEIVYVLGTPGSHTVKIGRTTNLAKRVAEIQRMSPVPLVVLWTHPGGHELETNLHRHFAPSRSHGEWFTFASGNPVQEIKAAVEATPWLKRSRISLERKVVRPTPQQVSKQRFAVMLEAARHGAESEYDTSALEGALAARWAEVESIPDKLERFRAARELRAQIAEGQRVFIAMERDTVAALKQLGLTWRQIGELLGMSGARAEQIAKAS